MLVQAMAVDGLVAVHPLLVQLGYEVEPEEVKRRFLAVAESDGRVVGFLHMFARPALEKPPEVIVQSLVVDSADRMGGAGRRLMDAAEQWALEEGFRSVSLSSQTDRDDAHAFYARLGYRRVATSHALGKILDP